MAFPMRLENIDPTLILDKARLQKLKSLNLLDTGAEQTFDRLTSLACEILDVPVCLLSFIANDKQFFKSQNGLPEPYASRREIPLSQSICQYTLSMDEPLVLDDIRQHEFLAMDSVISEMNIIAYAGIPLITGDGHVLGVFCASDSQPRKWTDRDIRILKGLSESAMTEIELRSQIIQRRQTEANLRTSEAKFSEIAESASDAIIVLNDRDEIQYCNLATTTIFGYETEELLQQPVMMLIRGESPDLHKTLIISSFEQPGKSSEWRGLRFLGQHKNGHTISIEASFGQFERYQQSLATIIIRDISQQVRMERELRESEARYLQILDAIPDLVFVKDPQSRLVWANQAFQDYYGKPLNEMIGALDAGHAKEEFIQQYSETDRLVFEEGKQLVIDQDLAFRREDMRHFLTTKTPLFDEDDHVSLLVGISRDITDAKNLENYLTEALQANQELVEMKSNFTSMVSHEFRTPLAVILSATELLMNYHNRLADERREQKLSTIRAQVLRLTRLMDHVLLVNKGDAKGLTFNPLLQDVPALSVSIIEEIRMRHEDANVSIDYTPGEGCGLRYIDADIFRHIFQNLLSNAIKYSHPGTKVKVRLKCNESSLILLIADRGIGIPAENHENLFQTFHRANNVGTIQGTGLGMSIVKRAVDTHGGTIKFRSIENQGTIFIVKLPASKEDPRI